MLTTWNPKSVLIVGGVAALAVWYVKSQAGEAAEKAAQAVNPVNPDNIFNRGAQSLWDVFTDGKGTIGTDIYDFVHDPEAWWN